MNQFKEGDSMEDLKPRYCIENDFAGQRELADREKSPYLVAEVKMNGTGKAEIGEFKIEGEQHAG